jgi:3-hydroxybutyryl-CoA dehydratase
MYKEGMMLEIGKKAFFAKTITETDVALFAGITGDFNPIHIDEESAKKSVFKTRVAHGMLSGSMISTVLGTKMPGPGTIYLEQNLKFKKPVYINDTVTVCVEVSDIINPEKGIYKLNTVVTNQNCEIVTEGYAVVKYQG